MFDMTELLDELFDNGDIDAVRLNRTTQFGTPTRQYLGARFLPEREVEQNEYTEDEIRFHTIIAVDGDRYSPAQIREGGNVYRSMRVTLGNSDIARQLTARDYEAVMRLLNRDMDFEALTRVLNWVDIALNLPLVELNEKQRWDCILNAQVVRRGDNSFQETVYYPNPPGHRLTLADDWSDPAIDPWPDILAAAYVLQDKGFEINAIVTSRKATSILMANPNMSNRAGLQPLILNGSGNLVQLPSGGRMNRDALNGLFERDGLPAPITYDLRYRTQVGQARFFAQDAMAFICTTGRDETITTEEEELLVQDTLGYVGIGPAVGQPDPGRVVWAGAFTRKPPRIEGEAWQSSLPVLQEPEAVMVLRGIQ